MKYLKNAVLASLLTLSSSLVCAQLTPEADFAARCAAPGVVKCTGFDNTTSDIVRNNNLWPGDGGYWGGSLDTNTKASGAGSLHFLVPGNRGTSDISGSWNAPLGGAFGPNTDFYVQFRFRISPEMLSNIPTWRSGTSTAWKTVLFHRTSSTCGQIEITTTNNIWDNSGAPQMYSGCGALGFTTSSPGGAYNYGGNLSQQGASSTAGYNCDFNNISKGAGNGAGCFIWTPNKWMTLYYKIHLGDMNGGANGAAEAFIAMDGGPYVQWINVKNLPLENDGAGLNKYNSITFTPYMTGLNRAAGVDAHEWYDELIVSTQPIAAPGAAAPLVNAAPSQPRGFSLR